VASAISAGITPGKKEKCNAEIMRALLVKRENKCVVIYVN
jgi:hypothetical protein